MKFLDEYRDQGLCRQLVDEIHRVASRQWTLMEVCGGQTHGLLRFGVDRMLEGPVRLIHGPGCPVCVTPAEVIDRAIDIARRPDVVLTSFGDMLRVPGNNGSLLRARGEGADVRFVYSPLDAVAIARRESEKQVVFLAVGFETTAPATAIAVRQAAELKCENFWLLPAHVRVEPAMELLAAAPDRRLDGFLAAGHVCAITGSGPCERLADRYRLPIVVTGFEPADLLYGILNCVRQLEAGTARVVNGYRRAAGREGNRAARRLIEEVFQPCDRDWRGMGMIPRGGLELRGSWARFDAFAQDASRHGSPKRGGGPGGAAARRGMTPPEDPPPPNRLTSTPLDEALLGCRSGEVLTGVLRPPDCEHFGTRCTPERPLGAPMVSHEGACAAYFHYRPPAASDSGTNLP